MAVKLLGKSPIIYTWYFDNGYNSTSSEDGYDCAFSISIYYDNNKVYAEYNRESTSGLDTVSSTGRATTNFIDVYLKKTSGTETGKPDLGTVNYNGNNSNFSQVAYSRDYKYVELTFSPNSPTASTSGWIFTTNKTLSDLSGSARYGKRITSKTFSINTYNAKPTATVSATNVSLGSTANVSWKFSDADGDTVSLKTLVRYFQAPGTNTWTTDTLISSGSTKTSYSDTISNSFAGGKIYYYITFEDSYGGTGNAKSSTYNIDDNTAPTTPGIPSFTTEVKGGEALTVSWTAASDSDGNLSGYILQVQLDSGSWTQIYKGSARTYSYTVPKDTESIAFRVKAYDSYSAESSYATSSTVAVSNDIIGIQGANAIISGVQKDLTGVGYVCIAGVWKSLVNSYTCIDGIWKSMMGGSNIVNLPDGYTRAEYIRSTGTQWIDTGFIPNANTRIVMDVENLTATASTGYFGARSAVSSTNAYACVFFTNTNGESNMRLDYYGSTKTVSCNSLQRLLLDWNKNVTTIGDVTTVTNTASSNSSAYNLYLLAINTANSPQFGANAKLYSCQIYDNGTLIRDYIPCANSNGEAGLWDKVNGVFYGNSGSGEFLINGELPSGYTQVEYIQSSGTQYINTAFTANNNTKVVMDCEITYPSGWAMVMGSYNSGAYFSWWTKDSNIYAYYGSANQNTTGSTGRTTITADKNVWSAGDSSLTFTASSFTATTPIYLFSISNGGDYALGSMKLYSCQIYDNGTLVRSFVPCTNASGTAGLYDVVNGVFYTNAGTGEFLTDNEIENDTTKTFTIAGELDTPIVCEFEEGMTWEEWINSDYAIDDAEWEAGMRDPNYEGYFWTDNEYNTVGYSILDYDAGYGYTWEIMEDTFVSPSSLIIADHTYYGSALGAEPI